jgi:hypothetical protein
MTYGKSPQKAAANREWDRFVRNNQPMVMASGIRLLSSVPSTASTTSCCRGHADHHMDAGDFRVESLNQYNALVTLTESYFAAGYEWFTPLALRPADQDTLRMRFGK